MSLFGAMSTALSGLSSQSAALGNISDNIANSQTVGYKEVNTSFIDYITSSTATQNTPGAVVAQPDYMNSVAGTVAQSSDPLAMAISGQGFFPVSENVGASAANPTFDAQPLFTRAGDFTMNAGGYLQNGAGLYLQGWPQAANGTLDTNTLAPIQVSQSIYAPVATGAVTLSANLPPATSATAAITSNVSVYDAEGTAHQLTLSFAPVSGSANTWTVAAADDTGTSIGGGTVAFGANGTLVSVTQGSTVNSTAGAAATLSLTTSYPAAGGGAQTIALDLGTIGGTSGLTQFAGSTYSLRGISQDGVPPGSFSSVSTTTAGDVMVNYDNGQSRRVGRVPLITFDAPDALQRQNGSAFTATAASGAPRAQSTGTNGAGALVTGSVEQSNVDLATQFSRLIVAQQAYSANAKMVTTSSDMMQTTLDMKR